MVHVMTAHDWVKAPASATHFGPARDGFQPLWYKKVRGVWHMNRTSKDDPERWFPLSSGPTKRRLLTFVKRPGHVAQPDAYGPMEGIWKRQSENKC